MYEFILCLNISYNHFEQCKYKKDITKIDKVNLLKIFIKR